MIILVVLLITWLLLLHSHSLVRGKAIYVNNGPRFLRHRSLRPLLITFYTASVLCLVYGVYRTLQERLFISVIQYIAVVIVCHISNIHFLSMNTRTIWYKRQVVVSSLITSVIVMLISIFL